MSYLGIKLQLVVLILTFSAMSSLAYAQFGEIAGQLHTNVSIGSSNSVSFTLVNGGSTPIKFQIIPPPQLQSATSNTLVPTVTANPMNGTITPGSEFTVNVTVYVPSSKNNTPGTQWTGIIQAVVVSNSSSLSGSGANIQEGVAKIITITAQAPRSSPLPYAIGAVIIIAISVGYVYVRKKTRTASTSRSAAGRRSCAKIVMRGSSRKRSAKRRARSSTTKRSRPTTTRRPGSSAARKTMTRKGRATRRRR